MTAQISDFTRQVAEIIEESGYKAILEPSEVPNRRLWQSDLASLIRGPKYHPDILVQGDGTVALIEAKTAPILLGGVMQARRYEDYFDADVIVCFPDTTFPEIPMSVREFAASQSIRLCPLSGIADALVELLGPSTPDPTS